MTNKKHFIKYKGGLIINLMGLVFLSFSTLSCSLFKKYQHKRCALYQTDVLFEDSNNVPYFEVGTASIFLCKYSSQKPDCRYEYVNIYDGKERLNYDFSDSNDDCFFVCLSKNSYSCKTNHKSQIIKTYDKEFSEISTLRFEDYQRVRDVCAGDKYLYICLRDTRSNVDSLFRYDYMNNSMVLIAGDVADGNTYNGEDINLYLKTYDYWNNDRCIGKYTDKTRLLGSKNNYFTNSIGVRLSDNHVVINSNGTTKAFNKEFPFTDFYKKVYLIDNQLIFGAYKYEPSDLCVSNTIALCECSIRESYLYKYDILNNNLSLINSYESGSFLIDYDLDGAAYYYNGGLYVNNVLQKECEKIEPKELTNSDNPTTDEDDWHLSYYKGNFYGI